MKKQDLHQLSANQTTTLDDTVLSSISGGCILIFPFMPLSAACPENALDAPGRANSPWQDR